MTVYSDITRQNARSVPFCQVGTSYIKTKFREVYTPAFKDNFNVDISSTDGKIYWI